MNPEEITGEWIVLKSWGYQAEGTNITGAEQEVGLEVLHKQTMIIFDRIMQLLFQNSQEGDGFKIVTTVGDVTIEASTFPKGGGYSAPRLPGPGPAPVATGTPAELIAQLEFFIKKGQPAAAGAGFAFAHLTHKDRSENPAATALQRAIVAADGALTVDGYTYKMGGTNGTLINRTVAKT